jgi:hypothetical protein
LYNQTSESSLSYWALTIPNLFSWGFLFKVLFSPVFFKPDPRLLKLPNKAFRPVYI